MEFNNRVLNLRILPYFMSIFFSNFNNKMHGKYKLNVPLIVNKYNKINKKDQMKKK